MVFSNEIFKDFKKLGLECNLRGIEMSKEINVCV
jgi:hypothetical protein